MFDRSFLRTLICGLAVVLITDWSPGDLSAQTFAPGETIEYKVGSTYPERWERGVIIREIDGGGTRQYLIRQKPNQFFPEGFEIAYNVSDLRKIETESPPKATDGINPSAPLVRGSSTAPTEHAGDSKTGQQAETADAPKLLSKEDILSYAATLFGEGDPFAHPRREELLNQLRDLVKARGTNFQADLEFSNQLMALGAYSTHISFAIASNHGPAPKLSSYYGTFLLRAANRGSRSVTRSGSRVEVTREDSQAESGELTINEDGTYLWKPGRNDAEELWLRGKWREVADSEKPAWEGGPAIWLERAKQGYDCMMRASREPGYEGWIEVGMGVARSPVEYGRPK
ncbi:MAG TPA: hypothetical protein PKD64_11530 [Pirellulaceae bacterium]|nr:hypothetical protein [Pirellulaceae bacterium]HMO92814.1 hypothetical protein [Pirellulaceae bacterium]HMP69443.1 hypothetical protein [Pirellulaceae bacterium]